jgi:hypothetical protein
VLFGAGASHIASESQPADQPPRTQRLLNSQGSRDLLRNFSVVQSLSCLTAAGASRRSRSCKQGTERQVQNPRSPYSEPGLDSALPPWKRDPRRPKCRPERSSARAAVASRQHSCAPATGCVQRGRPGSTAQRARLDDRQAGSAYRSAGKRARQNRYCSVARSGAARRCRCGARTLASRPAGVPPRPLRQWRRTTNRSGARERPCCLTATVDPKHTPPRDRGQRLNRERPPHASTVR